MVKTGVETWLSVSIQDGVMDGHLKGPDMAWFLWTDRDVDEFMRKYEPELYEESFLRLPHVVGY